mgnify:CR=1 FL=1
MHNSYSERRGSEGSKLLIPSSLRGYVFEGIRLRILPFDKLESPRRFHWELHWEFHWEFSWAKRERKREREESFAARFESNRCNARDRDPRLINYFVIAEMQLQRGYRVSLERLELGNFTLSCGGGEGRKVALAVGRKAVRGSDFACESVGRAIPVHLRPSCTPPGAREKQRERERERERERGKSGSQREPERQRSSPCY